MLTLIKMYSIVIIAILCILFDVSYFLRSIFSVILYGLKGKISRKSILAESVINGICLTSDMDLNWHMNNSRYLRECDFARVKLYLEKGLWAGMRKHNATMLNAGNNIRYRRSIQLFTFYQIKSKILHWNSKAFYIEHKIVDAKTNFICAIAIVKMVVKGSTPEQVVKEIEENTSSPPPPAELEKLMESHQLSSEKLRKQS